MSTMITEVYDALKSANVDDDKARAAASALSEQRITDLRSKMLILQWMVGSNIALTIFVLGVLFKLVGDLP